MKVCPNCTQSMEEMDVICRTCGAGLPSEQKDNQSPSSMTAMANEMATLIIR